MSLGSRTNTLAWYKAPIIALFEWSWGKAEGSRRILSPAGSSAPSRREKQHCGEASADNWRILAKLRCFNNRWWGKGLASSLSIILQCRRSLHMTSCAVVSDLLLNGPCSTYIPLPSLGDSLMGSGLDFPASVSGWAIPPLRDLQGGNISLLSQHRQRFNPNQYRIQEHRGVVTGYQTLHLLLLFLYKTKVLCEVSCFVPLGCSLSAFSENKHEGEGYNRRMTVILFLWALAPSCSMTLYGSMHYRLRDEKT